MSIDPRMVKQLLDLQFRSSDPLLPRQAVGENEGGFSALLETLLRSAEDGGKAVAAGQLPTAGAYPLPTAAYAAHAALTGRLRPSGSVNPSAYDPIIEAAAELHSVDARLVKAVVSAESSFNPYAVSSAGAKGLMQLMDATGAALGVADPVDPTQNVDGGTRYLAELLRKYNGNEQVALAAYNAGPGRVDRLGIRTDADLGEKLHLLPQETQAYIRKVQSRKEQYG